MNAAVSPHRSLMAPLVAYSLLLYGTFSQAGFSFCEPAARVQAVSNEGLHWSDGARRGARPFRGRRGRAVGHLSLQLVHSLLQLSTLRQQLLVALVNRFLDKKNKTFKSRSTYGV